MHAFRAERHAKTKLWEPYLGRPDCRFEGKRRYSAAEPLDGMAYWRSLVKKPLALNPRCTAYLKNPFLERGAS